jgi:hypothetical protein
MAQAHEGGAGEQNEPPAEPVDRQRADERRDSARQLDEARQRQQPEAIGIAHALEDPGAGEHYRVDARSLHEEAQRDDEERQRPVSAAGHGAQDARPTRGPGRRVGPAVLLEVTPAVALGQPYQQRGAREGQDAGNGQHQTPLPAAREEVAAEVAHRTSERGRHLVHDRNASASAR